MRWHITDTNGVRANALQYIADAPAPFTVTVAKGKPRTLDQNALVHKWYGEIAQHHGDRTAAQVKGECHVKYGLIIRRRDPVFEWVWQRAGAQLGYEKQCALFASEGREPIFAMTSAMTTKELTEYMDAMGRDYRAQGVPLTDPEAMKYGASL